jgi:Putative adhesin
MKRIATLTGLILMTSALTWAQEAERVVVPARNTTRPRVVNASVLNGSITVKAYDGKEVIVEAGDNPSARERRRQEASPDGLKRLDLPGRSGLEVEEDDNVITVHTRVNGNSNLTITVPVNTSLKLRGTNGGQLNVEGVNGEIDVNNLNGGITLTNVSGSVIAHSLNGSVKVTMAHVDPGKQLSFSTLNGSIDVALPGDLKANLKLKADNGDIFTDFDVKFDAAASKPITENNSGQNGKFRVRFDKTVYGTINGGGPEVSFQTFNGRISIRKK